MHNKNPRTWSIKLKKKLTYLSKTSQIKLWHQSTIGIQRNTLIPIADIRENYSSKITPRHYTIDSQEECWKSVSKRSKKWIIISTETNHISRRPMKIWRHFPYLNKIPYWSTKVSPTPKRNLPYVVSNIPRLISFNSKCSTHTGTQYSVGFNIRWSTKYHIQRLYIYIRLHIRPRRWLIVSRLITCTRYTPTHHAQQANMYTNILRVTRE